MWDQTHHAAEIVHTNRVVLIGVILTLGRDNGCSLWGSNGSLRGCCCGGGSILCILCVAIRATLIKPSRVDRGDRSGRSGYFGLGIAFSRRGIGIRVVGVVGVLVGLLLVGGTLSQLISLEKIEGNGAPTLSF